MAELEVWLDDRSWGSHLPALIACVTATSGPVLELGVGDYSTPCLHSICCNSRRMLLSVEHDKAWMERFLQFQHDLHDIVWSGPDWTLPPKYSSTHWSVVFIDNSPGSRRGIDLTHYYDKTKYVVIHDCGPKATPDAPHEVLDVILEPMKKWPYQAQYTRYTPYTIVLGHQPIPEMK